MAIYQTRNCICAVQWDPEDKQSLENIKALVKDNPRLGWKVNDNILSNNVIICNCFGQQELCLHPYHYLVEGKRDSLFSVPPETFEPIYELDSGTAYQQH